MRTVLFTLLLFTVTSSHATLISLNDRVYGRGAITLDTDTGLEWLDAPLSGGYSYDQMVVELERGGAFAGFRYASREELTTFMRNAGIDCASFTHCNLSLKDEEAQRAIDFVALTGGPTGFRPPDVAEQFAVTGSIVPNFPEASRRMGPVFEYIDPEREPIGPRAMVTFAGSFGSAIDELPTTGHWLLRPIRSVPEPTTLLLLGLGLAGLGFARRRTPLLAERRS